MIRLMQRYGWLAFCVAAFLATAWWALRVSALPNDDQRLVVPVSTVWGLHACTVAIVAGLLALAPRVVALLGRRRALTAAAVAVGGYLLCFAAPRTSRIFFDEHIYMQIGQTIAHTGRAEGANYARVEYGKFEMYAPWVNKQPNGLPYLLSWIYRAVGVSETASHTLNRALTGLTAAALYLGLALAPWTLPAGAPLAAALAFLFTPLVPWWGHTVAVEPGAAATVVFAFAAACLHTRLRDPASAQGLPASAALLAGTTALAAYFRPESLLVFPLVAAVLWSTEDRFIEDLAAWGALALSLALALPTLMHLWSMRTEPWGATDGRRFATEFVAKNLEHNGGYFFDGLWFPVAGTVLALAGAGWFLVRARSAGLVALLWFALSWGIFIFYYAGGYFYGASSRYALPSCPPVALFMGIGAAAVFAWLRPRPLLLGTAAALTLVNWAAAWKYVPTMTREASEAVADADFVAREARRLPEGSLVVSSDPCMWHLQHINSSQWFVVDHLLRTELRELQVQYPGGIYYHWGFWQNAEPVLAREIATHLATHSAREVVRTTSQAYKLALWRLDTPEAVARFGGKGPAEIRPDTDLDVQLARARAAFTTPPAPPPPAQP